MSVMWMFSAVAFVVLGQQLLVNGFPFPTFLSPFPSLTSFAGLPGLPSLPTLPSLQSPSSFTLQPLAIATLPLATSSLGSLSYSTKCQVIDNIKDLEFPKIDASLENEKQLTFLCNDKTNRNFYFLTTSGCVVSGKTRDTKNAGEYYSLSHKKLDIEKDLDIDENALWQAVAKAENTYDSIGSLYGGLSSSFSHPLYSSILSSSRPTCTVKDNFEDVSFYPSVDVGVSPSDIAKLDNSYATELCKSSDKTEFYKLKTTASIVTKSGIKSSKYVIYSYPKGDDGKPDISRKIGQESGVGAAAGMAASSVMSLTF